MNERRLMLVNNMRCDPSIGDRRRKKVGVPAGMLEHGGLRKPVKLESFVRNFYIKFNWSLLEAAM